MWPRWNNHSPALCQLPQLTREKPVELSEEANKCRKGCQRDVFHLLAAENLRRDTSDAYETVCQRWEKHQFCFIGGTLTQRERSHIRIYLRPSDSRYINSRELFPLATIHAYPIIHNTASCLTPDEVLWTVSCSFHSGIILIQVYLVFIVSV